MLVHLPISIHCIAPRNYYYQLKLPIVSNTSSIYGRYLLLPVDFTRKLIAIFHSQQSCKLFLCAYTYHLYYFVYLAILHHILIKFLPPQGQKSSNPALNSSSAKDISRRRQPYHRIPQKERKAQSHGVEQLWMVCVLLTVPIARDGFRDASLRIFTTNLQRTNRD